MKKNLLNALVLVSASMLALSAPAARAAGAVSATLTHNSHDFTIDSVMLDGYEFFNCDSLESQISDMLAKMGAVNVKVVCTGDGDPEDISFSPSISMSYDSVRVATHGNGTLMAAYKPVEFHDTQNCFSSQQIFAEVKGDFDIQNLQGFSSCDMDESYDYSFSTLFAAH